SVGSLLAPSALRDISRSAQASSFRSADPLQIDSGVSTPSVLRRRPGHQLQRPSPHAGHGRVAIMTSRHSTRPGKRTWQLDGSDDAEWFSYGVRIVAARGGSL